MGECKARLRNLPGILFVTLLLALWAQPHRAYAQMKSGDWLIPERKALQKNPLPPTPQNIAAGKKIYLRDCSPCHGWTGNNDGPQAPKEIAKARKHTDPSLMNDTDGMFFYKIMEGLAPMPSTSGVLSDQERWQVILYLRTLSHKS